MEEGVHFEESPFGYRYICIEEAWEQHVSILQDKLRAAGKPINVYVHFAKTPTGEFMAYYTPCDREHSS